MNYISLVLLLIVFSGCVTVAERARGLPQTGNLVEGMTKKEVRETLGDKVIIGYEQSDNKTGTMVPTVVKNPIRKESFRTDRRTFEVWYYFTGIKEPDQRITDDELTPVVFEHGKIVGQGWDVLEKSRLPQ